MPGITARHKYRIKFPSLAEIYEDLEKKEENLSTDLKKIRDDQIKLKKDTNTLLNKIKREGKISNTSKMELERLTQKEEELKNRAESALNTLKSVINKANKNNLHNFQIMEKLAKMQDLFSEIASKDLKETIRNFNRTLENLDLKRMTQNLEITEESQKKLLEKLENTIAMFEKIKQEQKFEKINELAKKIRDMQRKINKELN